MAVSKVSVAKSGRAKMTVTQKAKKPAGSSSGSSAKNKNLSKAATGKPLDLKLVPKEILVRIYQSMLKSRALEERLIKIYKVGDAYFWIGGPGEEAFGVPLGLLANKGQGPEHDYLHMHYRCTPTLVAMGMEMIDSIRLIMNRATDRSAGGRNFSNHYCFPEWNVPPVTSPIGVQYITALGTAQVQKRRKTKGISIVTGGDAGTAEGDFASCLVWASRKGQELPLLITVQNNRWGISTSFEGQHGETNIADRARGFNIPSQVINGNDPVESYLVLKDSMDYIRRTGKPAFVEAHLSRLYGHSSATGANLVNEEYDSLKDLEQRLLKHGFLKEAQTKELWAQFEKEAAQAQQQVKMEPVPSPESVWDHIYAGNENADWRKF
jgi:2-oxoisovalerate dehydrogenase E1 component alpha subunit